MHSLACTPAYPFLLVVAECTTLRICRQPCPLNTRRRTSDKHLLHIGFCKYLRARPIPPCSSTLDIRGPETRESWLWSSVVCPASQHLWPWCKTSSRFGSAGSPLTTGRAPSLPLVPCQRPRFPPLSPRRLEGEFLELGPPAFSYQPHGSCTIGTADLDTPKIRGTADAIGHIRTDTSRDQA